MFGGKNKSFKIVFILLIFVFFYKIVFPLSILRSIQIRRKYSNSLNIKFSKQITKLNISSNKRYLDIYFAEKIKSKKLNFYFPIKFIGNRMRVIISGKVYWYKIKKYKNILNIDLYKYPRDLKSSKLPEPEITSYKKYAKYIKNKNSKKDRTAEKQNKDFDRKKEKKKTDKTKKNNKKTKIEADDNKKNFDELVKKTGYKQNKEKKEKGKEDKKKEEWTVVLDAGHGGKDPGAVGPSGRKEKHVVLNITKKIYKRLKKYKNLKLILIRKKDRFISLSSRAKIANEANADLFVSIHANAIGGRRRRRKTKGIETYFLSGASSDRAREVAIRENDSLKYEMKNYKKMDDVAAILFDMADSQYKKESSELAYMVQNNLIEATNTPDRGVQQALFYVLRYVSMPSVLIEVGFLSHPKEEKKLINSRYQEKLADKITAGIIKYLKKRGELYVKK